MFKSEKDVILKLKKVWDSMFNVEKYKHIYGVNEKFLPLSILIKAFEIQLEELKTIPCSCRIQGIFIEPSTSDAKDQYVQKRIETSSTIATPKNNTKSYRSSFEEDVIPNKLTKKPSPRKAQLGFSVEHKIGKTKDKLLILQDNRPNDKDLLFETLFEDISASSDNNTSTQASNNFEKTTLPDPCTKTLESNTNVDIDKLPSPNCTKYGPKSEISATYCQPAVESSPSNSSKVNKSNTSFKPPKSQTTICLTDDEDVILIQDSDDERLDENTKELEKYIKKIDDLANKSIEHLDDTIEASDGETSKRSSKRTPPKRARFAYKRDAVRKKVERAKMQGQTCKNCMTYYNALDSLDDEALKERLNKCSKHRGNRALGCTPPGFWNPLFTPSPTD